jgi:hypothetical protein
LSAAPPLLPYDIEKEIKQRYKDIIKQTTKEKRRNATRKPVKIFLKNRKAPDEEPVVGR